MDDVVKTRARRAMELGRLRTALVGGALVTIGLALLARWVPSGIQAGWLVLPFAAWVLVAWRGGALARGGMLGLIAGAAGWLVPMSVLRPCCAAMETTSAVCCTRPECCLEAGVALGVVLALLAPISTGVPGAPGRHNRVAVAKRTTPAEIDLARGKRAFAEQIAGTLLIAASTLGVRCTSLFLGESLGLLGGLAAGALVASSLRAVLARPLAV